MNKTFVFAILIAIAVAGNCGTYVTNCSKAWIGDGSSKKTAYVTCGLNGFVSHYDIKEELYGDDKCEGDAIATYQYLYRTKKYEDATDKNNAKYNTTLESVTVESDDVATYTKGLTCRPAMEDGKKYDLTEFACFYKLGFIEVNLYEVYTAMIGKYYDVVIKFENNQATFSNRLGYNFVKSSSFWGCFQGWSLTLLIIAIILVIVIIVVVIILVSKKGKKALPKKEAPKSDKPSASVLGIC